MAADNRSIVITLKLDRNSSEVSTEEQTNTDSASKKNDKGVSKKAVAAFAAIQLTQMAVQETVSWVEYFWNRELTLNDDYIGQRNKSVAIAQINGVVGALGTVGSMAAAGAAVGAVPGAIVGVVAAGAQIVRSNVQGQDQQNIMLRQMDAQLQFTRSRVGWSLKAASIGEDL